MSFYLTNEYAAACKADAAARALEALAFDLRDLGTGVAKDQARLAEQFAVMARRWKRDLVKGHEQKQPKGQQ